MLCSIAQLHASRSAVSPHSSQSPAWRTGGGDGGGSTGRLEARLGPASAARLSSHA